MRRSTNCYARLYLTADLQTCDESPVITGRKPGGIFGSMLHQFQPIDDLVAALDHIASRKIDA